MKKILAILMAICMLIPLFGINAFAQEEDHDLPIDYQFKKVEEKDIPANTKEISFDLFSGLQWDMKMIGMEEGWKSGLTGKGVRVGIVDSGLSDYTMDIAHVSSELSLKHDITVSIAVKPYAQFERFKMMLPYYRNVINEGIRYAG